MGTIRQFINDIQTEVKQISSDAFLPPRYIYSRGTDIIADFLKKDQDAKKKLQKLSEGWSELESIDLEEVPVISCADVDVRICDRMMRSKKKIPATYTYSYGDIIKHVSSSNYAIFFNPTTPRQWNSIQKRQYKEKDKYYYFFVDGYLYIPVPKSVDLPIEKVRMEAYFINKYEVSAFKEGDDCYECMDKTNPCMPLLDYEMVIPEYLKNDVKKELTLIIIKSFVNIPEDTYPNLNSLDKTNQRDNVGN